MPMVSPSLNLPMPSSTMSSSAAARPGATLPPAPPPAPTPPALPSLPSTTVSLSPQALSLASSHPSSSSFPSTTSLAQGGSIYDSIKNGISSAIDDVEDAISGGAHAIASGVETALSTANDVATGIVELPFAAVSKGCDAVGAVIDEL